MKRSFKHIFILTALLITGVASMAQTDRHYVIKRIDGSTVHYLSHAGNTLGDATTFGPDCIWYSPNNYNYYFMDGDAKKYLKAPLALDGTLSVATNPGTQTLNNNTQDYFFYDWDHGLARGIQLFGGTCPPEYSNGNECWQAVWLSYENSQWKMSSVYNYEPTAYSARFLKETETVHEEAVSNETGGVGNLTDFSMNYQESHGLNGTAENYSCTVTPAYTHYYIEGLDDDEHNTHISAESYYYYDSQFNTSLPNSTNYSNAAPSNYAWTISCDGNHLSFEENSNEFSVSGSDLTSPTLYYRTANNSTSHKTATLTLTVTYAGGVTQTRTATVTVKTLCQNPTVLDNDKVISYVGVTVSWLPTADTYKVFWKKDDSAVTTWDFANVGNVTSYTITGLEYETDYKYKVQATSCSTEDPTAYSFTTPKEPGLFVSGAIFGGGRMANVGGKTEVVVINCDSIGDIYGGNDIAGSVLGNSGVDGSTITLGVDGGGTYASYGTTPNNGKVRVGSVYGGGNGYYAYNGTSFVAADENYASQEVAPGEMVKAMTQSHQVGEVVWTNTSSTPKTLDFPSIVKTNITVTNNKVKVDSIFGGAKNAFLTYNDWRYDGSLITVDGGTILSVFGGNNFGGDQGYGKHHIVVNGTKTDVEHNSIVNTSTHGYGRDFGIRYLFGGGNKVYGSTTNVEIFGGQCDTIFAGGNAADVYAANMTVNCAIAAGSGNTYGKVYSNAINSYSGGVIEPKTNYGWDGYTGIYNVRTLFGGNNMATFNSKLNQTVPTISLVSGSIGTVYGGGNAGDVWGISNDDGNGGSLTINENVVKYGTHVKMDSPTILIDNLYGGCQVSDVRYSTWVELLNGHVGTVYGGCNVSGDVGSTLVNTSAPVIPQTMADQEVFGGTYVVASGGIVHKNLFAGGNGYYHCTGNNGCYISGLDYGDTEQRYIGLSSPTHNETHVIINGNVTVEGNVYAGGNLARVGFNSNTIGNNPYPQMVGLSSVRMNGGTVNGSVYGGGNMADVYGSCEVQVSGGTIVKSLYGGNDRLGKVAVPYSNRILPPSYETASDDQTSLMNPNVYTYVGLTGNPSITNVYGGGNGDYEYFTSFEAAASYTGPKEKVVTCDINNQPIQQCTFVDIGVAGGDSNGAHIGTVYGGGDGVEVTGFVTVFLNVKTDPIGFSNVGTIYGGNNKGDLTMPADIILLNGQVNTVYGGCNQGAMTATGNFVKTIGGYDNIGSYVHLRDSYDPDGAGNTYNPVATHVKIMDAVYGGCRMNGVTNNSLVLVDGGNYTGVGLYGGSDISGTVSGISRVAIQNNSVVTNVFGGGNGNYSYVNNNVYPLNDPTQPIATGTSTDPITRPYSGTSCVDMLSGTADNLYAGGNACGSGGTVMQVTDGTVKSGVYGGSNAQGTIEGNILVNITGGTIGASTSARADVHGGGYGSATASTGNVTVNIATDGATTGPTINGDVYGGSALGQVSASGKLTQVNFYKGTINGDVYGGALGNNTYAAEVSGNIEVNIRGGVFNSATGTAGGGSVYGCNNANGTPKGNVAVNIYATDHDNGPTNNEYPSTPSGGWNATTLAANTALPQAYALSAVYGGGNQAAYIPAAVAAGDDPHSATVHVYNCNNTIQNVYGGGNAANVGSTTVTANTNVVIDGGRIKQVFGGGNGAGASNPGANIVGTATATLYAGIIDQAFGGSNEKGNITTTHLIVAHDDNNACEAFYSELFGGGNLAEIVGDLVTDIQCGVGSFGDFYGGANQATIKGNVTLNVYGGTFANVYGGSKGVAGGVAADIKDNPATTGVKEGNVTLNLYGGDIGNAFGGSNQHGNIEGVITVNVLDQENCPLNVTNLYGAGNVTAYTPLDVTSGVKPTAPVVNVTHVKSGTSSVGNVFGGALGATATVTSNPQVTIGNDDLTATTTAIVSGNVYGGGDLAPVVGSTTVNVQKDDSSISLDVYGGGNKANVSGSVSVSITGGTVSQDVYGGGALADVNVTTSGGTSSQTPGTTTSVTLSGGTVRNLYGGGLGDLLSLGGEHTDVAAKVWGDVTVTFSGGTATNVFGCNNLNGAPQSTVTVNMTGGNVTNIMGGGDQAAYAGTPAMTISGGQVLERVFGGGNAADVNGTNISITGGTFGLGTGEGRGVFGGCNASGSVNGNVLVDITGGTFGSQDIINQDVIADKVSVNIHGGGYGQSTATTGNVTVNYGSNSNTHSAYPKLYGDLYGGSALGSVNDPITDETTVNVRKGSFVYATKTVPVLINGQTENIDIQYGGSVYGGGLGQQSPAIAATVNGTVYVNVGAPDASSSTGYSGLADLANCSVYGCNNLNGSPQSDVYVRVYQTYHTANNVVSGTDFVIGSVYGGGNEADYEPAGTTTADPPTGPRTHVYIYSCENTIQYVYGGGNAADAVGTAVIIEGGHFGDVFGGGNGLLVAANIGSGGVGMNLLAGRVNYQYEGSNLNGINTSGVHYTPDATGFTACAGGVVVETHFFGANEAVTYGDLINTIECSNAGDYNYTNVFAGSRFATIYGDVRLTVKGGNITNLFGGSQGYPTKPAHIRRFPTQDEITNNKYIHGSIPQAMLDFLARPENQRYYGHGGNVVLTVEGGSIGNIYGGNQVKGDIDGIIIVIVDSTQLNCPLTVNNIYAASDRADYEPIDVTDAGGTHKPQSPLVYLKNGTVTNNVLGGGFQGNVTGNPVVVIGNNATGTTNKSKVGGNVFGGGYEGNVTGNTTVILQGKVTVNADIYGGGHLGDVNGKSKVTLAPDTHTLTITQPQQGGTITVNSLSSSTILVGENTSLPVVATPATGYVFNGWTVTGEGASVSNASSDISIFNMGTGDATISASFVPQAKSRNK